MKITEKLVRELQERIDISYEEAEYFLKKTKGNVNMAYEMILRRRNSSWGRFKTGVQRICTDLFVYRFIMLRKQETLINLPLILILVFLFVSGIHDKLVLMLFIFIIALATECEVKIKKTKDADTRKYEEYSQDKKTYKEQKNDVKASSQQEQKSNSNSSVPTVRLETVEVVESKLDIDEAVNKKDDDFYEIVIED